MNDMRAYFRGIEMYNEAIMVKVAYPNKWKAYPSDDGRIKVTPSETDPNVTYYYADSKDTTYEEMFETLDNTETLFEWYLCYEDFSWVKYIED